LTIANDDENIKRIAIGLGGVALGALLLRSHHEESRKSKAETDDPEGVEYLCSVVGELLQEWTPPDYECEDDYTDDLYDFLCDRLPEALGEDDDEDDEEDVFEDEDDDAGGDDEVDDGGGLVCCRPSTPYGAPDILIDDRLVLEIKINPNKGERDRLIGQCCGYSQEWVTWAVVVDMPQHRVRELEELLRAKSLHYIEVVPFS
jgi:hypothetical protein